MAEEYFIHEVIISDSKGNLFNYHSDYMNENFSYDKEHDQISEYKPTQNKEDTREEEQLLTYCRFNDMHNLVVFNPSYVSITECDDEGIQETTQYTHKEFVKFANENNIQFYDWEVE